MRWIGCWLLLVVGPGASAALEQQVDLSRCRVSPAGRWSTGPAGALLAEVRTPLASSSLTVVFREPVAIRAADRLVLEAGCHDLTATGVCFSRLNLLAADGRDLATYEPDLLLPPEYNWRTALIEAFDRRPDTAVAGVRIHVWMPRQLDRPFTVRLRQLGFQDPAEVRSLLQPLPPATRPAQLGRTGESPARWTNFGPGGGGWYRCLTISPHDGALWAGGDVGGVYRSGDDGRSWQTLNEGLGNTYVNQIACHPTDSRLVFAGTDGGVARSTDGGAHWTMPRAGFPPLRTFAQSAPIAALWLPPQEPDLVLAGAGHERNYGALADPVGGVVYRSVDRGLSWRPVALPGAASRLSIIAFVADPDRTSGVWACTQAGLYYSADLGLTWQRYGAGLEGWTTGFLAVVGPGPRTLLLTASRGPDNRGGVLRSQDAGQTWQLLSSLPTDPDCWRIATDPGDSQRCWVGWHRRQGLWTSADAGRTWRELNADNVATAWFLEGNNVTGLAVDPKQPQRLVYCNDMEIYSSGDGGRRWQQVCTELVAAATDEEPARWRGRGADILCVGGPQALAVQPQDPRELTFAYWDCTAWQSRDGGASCYRLTNGLDLAWGRVGAVLYDPDDPRQIYLTSGENYSGHRLYRSRDGGRRFHLVGSAAAGLPPGGVFSLALDRMSPPAARTLLAAVTEYGVYRSVDGGFTWSEASAGLPADSRQALQVALDPRRPGRAWLVSGAHYHPAARRRVPGYVARSDDGGLHWRIVKGACEPQCLALDPFDPETVYVGNRNFSGVDYPQAFYRTRDGGQTWQSTDQADLVAGPGSRGGDQGERVMVLGLVADPSRRGRLYLACSDANYDRDNGRGVFVSDDSGDTWRPFTSAGLTCLRVGTLVLDPTDPGRLYAGTGGNGFFRWGPAP